MEAAEKIRAALKAQDKALTVEALDEYEDRTARVAEKRIPRTQYVEVLADDLADLCQAHLTDPVAATLLKGSSARGMAGTPICVRTRDVLHVLRLAVA